MLLSQPRPGLARLGGRPSATWTPSPYVCGVVRRHLTTAVSQRGESSFSLADSVPTGFATSFSMYLLTHAAPAIAAVDDGNSPFNGVTANSLYVTLALFLMSVPGIWSQVKRAPISKRVRKTFQVAGPQAEGAMPLDERARQVFRYFKSYNYEVAATGEVITFVGTYAMDRGQAAAVTFYTAVGMASVALVLSILVPSVGNGWYALVLLSPGAWLYYTTRAERQEEVKVKMVTSDDEMATDIIMEGDAEEIDRFRRELGLVEKGMVLVKGIFEQ